MAVDINYKQDYYYIITIIILLLFFPQAQSLWA